MVGSIIKLQGPSTFIVIMASHSAGLTTCGERLRRPMDLLKYWLGLVMVAHPTAYFLFT